MSTMSCRFVHDAGRMLAVLSCQQSSAWKGVRRKTYITRRGEEVSTRISIDCHVPYHIV